jgi:hypothetical protein
MIERILFNQAKLLIDFYFLNENAVAFACHPEPAECWFLNKTGSRP